MKVSVALFGPEHEAAASEFNRRMRSAGAPTAFLLPERSSPPVRTGGVTVSHYVALDESNAVRGGVICQHHPAVAGAGTECVINIQSPLSEGIIDPAYTFVAPALIRHAIRQSPCVFVVGMGKEANPLPRLLKAMGWKIARVPFYFRMLRPSRCVRRLGPLRNTAVKRLAADVAAYSGMAALAGSVVHRVSTEAKRTAASFQTEPAQRWSDWADSAWSAFAPGLSFGVLRTNEVLPFFYSFSDRSPRVWVLKRNGRVEGWFGMLIAAMSGNSYFGDLVVATVTDCVGTPEAVQAGMILAIGQARSNGADILITNQQHRLLRDSCLAAGWRAGPTNFLLATSRALTEKIREDSVYITRRDGDGLVNLSG